MIAFVMGFANILRMLINESYDNSSEQVTDLPAKSVKSYYRFYALDALRAFVMLFALLEHSTLAYTKHHFPLWPIQDFFQHSFFDFLMYTIHACLSELFFIIAGFFAHFLLENNGAWSFIKNRLSRIGVPFILGWPIILLCILLIPIKHNATSVNLQVIPIFHLWFSYYLLIIYPMFLMINYLMSFSKKIGDVLDGLFEHCLQSPHFIAFFVLMTTPLLLLMEKSYVDTTIGFMPIIRLLLYYGIFFSFGLMLHRQANLLQSFATHRRTYLYIAIASTIFLFIELCRVPTYPAFIDLEMIVLRIIYATVTWSLIFSSIGYLQTYCNKENAVIRYLANASYWLYLSHLPLVMALQNFLIEPPFPIPNPLKAFIVFGVTLVILLAFYHLLVRRTWIGAMLNGPKFNMVVPAMPS